MITGADSGIGRAVALAFAREGADVARQLLDEHEDAKEMQCPIEDAGRKCRADAGRHPGRRHCRAIIEKCVSAFGRDRHPREQRRASGHIHLD